MRHTILLFLFAAVSTTAQAKPYFQKPARPITLSPNGAAIAEDTGTLLVKGDAATSQDASFTAHWCAGNGPGPGNCERSVEGQLNVSTSGLPAGKYWIKQAEAIVEKRVEVHPAMASILTLKSFTVSENGAGLKYRVFVDTNDRATRARMLAFAWDTADVKVIRALCGNEETKTKEAEKACAAWSKGPAALENTWIRFESDARVAWAELFVRYGQHGGRRFLDVRWNGAERLWMGGTIAGESIVLPSGVYGVRIKNRVGLYQEKYGVEVQ